MLLTYGNQPNRYFKKTFQHLFLKMLFFSCIQGDKQVKMDFWLK